MRSTLVGALFALATVAASQEAAQEVLEHYSLEGYKCDHSGYEISLLSADPVVIYIENFLTPFERQHMMRVTNGTFYRSNVAGAEGDVVSNVRTSSSTTAPSDEVARCISERARHFQGLDMPSTNIEPIQLVRYNPGEQYQFHVDWFNKEATKPGGHADVGRGGNRVSSFFAYVSVSDDIVGGGTAFPKLKPPPGNGWCKFIECDNDYDSGVTFRAVEGNAVYWSNLRQDPAGMRVGDVRVLHAGLPVIKGQKVGMNIWTKEATFN
ncbi:oxidoreductase [Sodiomyces alkalinus F11]|uniref:Oxidoreductase n=1 Tax=Sodiomyces alkalinus (strain CBS 110278 / VKM F-3762 / F11) TaxID=1314773 RepID=A0A3N2PTJ2_SODAK|nr:oxidoreductase [Sodiomyces alkalinus F11]ROT37811.1 oxidoreductase [Sodiomyces alkalinus F11]